VAISFDRGPALGGTSLAKLKASLDGTSVGVPKLCAELLWVMYLSPTPTNTSPSRKTEIIKEVHDLSGTDLSVSNLHLSDPLASGIGNPGISFNTRRWDELRYLIRTVVAIKKLSKPDRKSLLSDPWKARHILDEVADGMLPQMSHMLRYPLFPGNLEPIFNRRDKSRIIESFGGIPRRESRAWPVTKLDAELVWVCDQHQLLGNAAAIQHPPTTDLINGGLDGAQHERPYQPNGG
jgi:5-methylcytosine-specific restriction protein B